MRDRAELGYSYLVYDFFHVSPPVVIEKFRGLEHAFRVQILLNTLLRTNENEKREHYENLAAENLKKWANDATGEGL